MILQKGMPSLASRSSPLEHVFGDAEGRAIGGEARQRQQDFLFGSFGSGPTKAASSVAEKYQVPMIASAASKIEAAQ
jgi:hypothetical protein